MTPKRHQVSRKISLSMGVLTVALSIIVFILSLKFGQTAALIVLSFLTLLNGYLAPRFFFWTDHQLDQLVEKLGKKYNGECRPCQIILLTEYWVSEYRATQYVRGYN